MKAYSGADPGTEVWGSATLFEAGGLRKLLDFRDFIDLKIISQNVIVTTFLVILNDTMTPIYNFLD
jgi:hypothetical protein